MDQTPITSAGLLGVDATDGMRTLLRRAKLRVLFEAQEIGKREPSAASSGTMLYVAGLLRGIPDAVLRPHFAEVDSMIGDNGIVALPEGSWSTVETNWTDAWCLAAMLTRPHLIEPAKLQLLTTSLLERQEGSGGWGLRPDRPGRPHPLFCLPVAIALRRLARTGTGDPGLVAAATENLILYLRQPNRDPLLVRLLRETELRMLGIRPRPATLDELHGLMWQAGQLHMDSVEIGREDQPLWYTMIDRSLMLLVTRSLWPVLDPVNVRLASELLDGFDAGQGGWRNHDTDSGICTWRTAESFLTVEMLAGDLRRAGVTPDMWKSRREASLALRATDGFDIGISFSAVQRDIAVRIKKKLRDAGLTVFYDEDYQHELLGADLNLYLHDTYVRRCRYAVAILSNEFIDSKWSGSLEWRAILTRLQETRTNFLLPYYVDDVDVPGLSSSIGFLSSDTHSPEEFAEVVIRKVLAQRTQRDRDR